MLSIRLMVNKILTLAFLLLANNVFAIMVGTYNLPPFSMREEGENIGMSTEAMRTLLEKAYLKRYSIIDYPLARGLAELSAGRIEIFYPYVLTGTKEDAPYILIGPIAKYSMALFVRKDYDHKVSIDAMNNKIIAVERGGVESSLLRGRSVHIEEATQSVSCLRMVLAERVSACAIGTLPGQYVAAINNLNNDLIFSETGSYADMYVAVSKALPPAEVQKIQSAFDSLKAENYFANQQEAYEKKFSVFIKSLS